MSKNPDQRTEVSPPSKEDLFRSILSDYIAGIKQLGLVEQVLLGVPSKQNKAYLVNVLRSDVDPSSDKDSRFSELTTLGGRLERTMAEDVLVRVTYLNPSKLEAFQNKCNERKISLTSLKLDSAVV